MSLRVPPCADTRGIAPSDGRSTGPSVTRRRIPAAVLAATLLLASGSGMAASTCKLGKLAEWTVRTGTPQVIVDGALNGKPTGILLDTGAAYSMVLYSVATELGLALRPYGGVRMFGVGGETNVNAARIDEFRIGDTVRRDWLVVVGGEADTFKGIGFILGEDFLGKVDIEFDLAHHAVRLFVPKDCAGAPLAYWATDGFGAVALDDSSSAHNQIMLTVQVNGRPVLAQLDSGAVTTIMTKVDAARLGVTPETPGVAPVGVGGGLGPRTMQLWNGPFASFSIGDETIRDTTIRFADLWRDATRTSTGGRTRQSVDVMPGMLLGADFLRSHRVLISNSQHRMYFTYAGGPVFSAPTTIGETDDDGNDAPVPGRADNPGAGK